MICRIPRLISVFILAFVSYRVSADNYDDAIRRVRKVSDSRYVRLLHFGTSEKGRLIPAFVIADFKGDPKDKARIFICSGQHGDEINPIDAVLTFAERISSDNDPVLLSKCIYIVVPIVNPDGFSVGRRSSANGVDINRDWSEKTSPEARYVNRIIRYWKPHILLDMHEWREQTSLPGNSIELARSSSSTQDSAMSRTAFYVGNGCGLSLIRCSRDNNAGLFHRHYSGLGYGAFLIETACDESIAEKRTRYISAILRFTEAATNNGNRLESISPASIGFKPELVSAYLDSFPEKRPVDNSGYRLLMILLAGYCVIVWVVRTSGRKETSVWSRRFRRCEMDFTFDPAVFDRPGNLRPITARSWAHRRMRSREIPRTV